MTPENKAPGFAPARTGRLRRNGVEYLIYAAAVLVVVLLAGMAITNLRARGIHAGFGFLWDTAGFDISFGLVPFDATSTYARAFLVGLLNTIAVSALAIAFGTLLGLGLAIARLSDNVPLRATATALTELVRNTPLLLHLFVWYFMVFGALPPVRQSISVAGIAVLNNRGISVAAPNMSAGAIAWLVAAGVLILMAMMGGWFLSRIALGQPRIAKGVIALCGFGALLIAFTAADWNLPVQRGFNVVGGLTIPPEFAALVVALAIYAAAFIGEAFRSGFIAVPASQWEAAHALGLRHSTALRLVILPQAIRVALPALGNQFVNVVKSSSLAAAVGFPDLMQVFGKTTLNQTGQAVEVIGITMAVYLAISLGISALVHRWGADHRLRS